MGSYIDYKIIPEKRLVVEFFSGILTLDKLVKFKSRVANDRLYNPDFNIIDDLREVRFVISKEELFEYVSFIQNKKELYGKRRSALLTATPNHVVFTSLFSSWCTDLPIDIGIVSSIDGALRWVGLPFSESDWVNQILVDFSHQSIQS